MSVSCRTENRCRVVELYFEFTSLTQSAAPVAVKTPRGDTRSDPKGKSILPKLPEHFHTDLSYLKLHNHE